MRTTEQTETTCCICGTTFSMDDVLMELRRKGGRNFYCPNGHEQHFTKSDKSTIDGLKKENEDLKKELNAYKEECRRLRCAILKSEDNKTIIEKLKEKFK